MKTKRTFDLKEHKQAKKKKKTKRTFDLKDHTQPVISATGGKNPCPSL